jgi:hypothetical protein
MIKFHANHTSIQVARQDFFTYVGRHIIEPFLQDEQGPALGFSTDYILGLSKEKVEDLGGEGESIIKQRADTKAKIARLEQAKEITTDVLRRTKVLDSL